MTVRIALLRAVNVGGTGRLAMADLRDFFAGLGFRNARTLIQTGNVVFESDGRSARELEAFLEAEAAARLSLETAFLIRTPEEWSKLVSGNPFPEKAKDDPRTLYLTTLKEAPVAPAITALQDAIAGPERIHVLGRNLYIDYPTGMGNSKLTNVLIERKLKTLGTARNWNTVLKIAELLE